MKNVCPACGQAYQITSAHVGQTMQCQKCAHFLQIQTDGLHLLRRGHAAGEPASVTPVPVQYDSENPSAFIDFLVFRRMVVPILIQILFWVGIVACIIGSMIVSTFHPSGLLILFLGPVVVRVYCELLIVIFRINETLTDIKYQLKRETTSRGTP